MIKELKKLLDEGGEYAALFIELSKAFNCLPQGIIITKFQFLRIWQSITETYA